MLNMLSSIVRNFFSGASTRRYPFVVREPFKDTRGMVEGIDINKCIFCGICDKKCPSLAITVNKGEKSWEIDRFKCIICGVCAEVCPKKCIMMAEKYLSTSESRKKDKVVLDVSNQKIDGQQEIQ